MAARVQLIFSHILNAYFESEKRKFYLYARGPLGAQCWLAAMLKLQQTLSFWKKSIFFVGNLKLSQKPYQPIVKITNTCLWSSLLFFTLVQWTKVWYFISCTLVWVLHQKLLDRSDIVRTSKIQNLVGIIREISKNGEKWKNFGVMLQRTPWLQCRNGDKIGKSFLKIKYVYIMGSKRA